MHSDVLIRWKVLLNNNKHGIKWKHNTIILSDKLVDSR